MASVPRKFSAIVQPDGKRFTGFRPEAPAANGQGRTKGECLGSLPEAVQLVIDFQDQELVSRCRKGAQRTLV
jgi:hypothetical protein